MSTFVYLACNACSEELRYWLLKGGDPAPGSPRATLLRLHPSHESLRGDRSPEG